MLIGRQSDAFPAVMEPTVRYRGGLVESSRLLANRLRGLHHRQCSGTKTDSLLTLGSKHRSKINVDLH